MAWGFDRGRVYNRRRDIHARFRGQERGGIITPAEHAVVIIVTGEGGLQHGYTDRLRDDGAFEYFGEGQIGDMRMAKGNAAIAGHSASGKSLLLFRDVRSGLQFVDEMVYETHHFEPAPDREGNMRSAIVFELWPIDTVRAELPEPVTVANLEDLRRRALEASQEAPGRAPRLTSVFERSAAVRDYVVTRAKGVCEGCSSPAPFLRPDGVPYLEPHHIKRLTDGGPDHPRLVIALCPNCHRRVHSGADGAAYNDSLSIRMMAIEPDTPQRLLQNSD
ncbi:MAG: HNH endonuclease [Aurantimonas endophytica]|uniref:HNH endonuclease n=1 Tax=Aurantimonas endophytica TaxID=1522175 RepID=UPI0030037EEA